MKYITISAYNIAKEENNWMEMSSNIGRKMWRMKQKIKKQ